MVHSVSPSLQPRKDDMALVPSDSLIVRCRIAKLDGAVLIVSCFFLFCDVCWGFFALALVRAIVDVPRTRSLQHVGTRRVLCEVFYHVRSAMLLSGVCPSAECRRIDLRKLSLVRRQVA